MDEKNPDLKTIQDGKAQAENSNSQPVSSKQKNDSGHHIIKFHWQWPGLRILKTCLAVFLCFFVTFSLEDPMNYTLQAAYAAIVVLKSDFDETWRSGLYRGLGTVIGSSMGLLSMQATILMGLTEKSILRMLVIVLFLFFTIWLTILVKLPDTTSFSAIIYLLTAIVYTNNARLALYASSMRFLFTVIGIIIALLVNEALPPYRKNKLK